MLRQGYSQIDLSTPVRTSCLGKKLVLPAVGQLLPMGNWISRGWSIEGWWEKQNLLITSATSEMTAHQSSLLISNSFSGPPAQHWSVWLGQKLVVCWENHVLVNSCVMKCTCLDSLQTSHGLLWWKIYYSLLLPAFFFLVFNACFTHTCLWNLSSYYYWMG